jgi:hypothetical protein
MYIKMGGDSRPRPSRFAAKQTFYRPAIFTVDLACAEAKAGCVAVW